MSVFLRHHKQSAADEESSAIKLLAADGARGDSVHNNGDCKFESKTVAVAIIMETETFQSKNF